MKLLRRSIIALVLTVLAVGCSTAVSRPDLSSYVWPRPPAESRIKLIKSIKTAMDIRGMTLIEKLFGTSASFVMGKPHGIATDKDGNIYVTDTLRRAVFIINLEKGSIERLFNPSGWRAPLHVAIDDSNSLIAVSDSGSSRVFVFNLHNRKLRYQLGLKGGLPKPGGVAFDAERQRLYVNDSKKHEIYAYNSATGEYISTVATAGTGPGKVYYPEAMATDKEGRLYVMDTMNFRVQIFDPEGKPAKAFGEHGDRPGDFARPKGITVSDDGFILITDAVFGNFQLFDKKGRFHLSVGSRGKGLGRFNIPHGIFIDKEDKIYVVDQINRRVQIFQLLSDRHKDEQKAKEEAAAEAK